MDMAVAIGLASWRVTAMLSRETGPLDMFVRIREFFGIGHDTNGMVISWPETLLAKLIVCPFCLSVWCAVVLYGVWRVEPVAVLVVAAMGVAALVETWVNK